MKRMNYLFTWQIKTIQDKKFWIIPLLLWERDDNLKFKDRKKNYFSLSLLKIVSSHLKLTSVGVSG